MRPVDDPALLRQLEGPKAVSDPKLIEQLEQSDRPSLTQIAKEISRYDISPGSLIRRGGSGIGETLMQMGTALAGALPGGAAGLYEAARGREYAPAFKFVQDFYTYQPRTEQGKKLSQAIGDIFHKYSQGVDYVADRTPGGPLAQTAVKTAGEVIPLVAPFAPRFIKRKPVTDTATVEALEKAPEARPTEPAVRPAPEAVESPQAALELRPAAPETVRTVEPARGKPVTDPQVLAELDRPLELKPQTEADLRAQSQRISEAERVESEAAGVREQKAVADRQVSEFELTGSERQADINPRQADLVEGIKEINVRERAYQPPKLDTQNDSITTAVSKLGGLRTDFAQDIPSIGAKATRDVRGFQFMVRKNGKTPDEMAEALHERGYLESRDLNEMFEKLDNEVRAGEPAHFSMEQNIDAYLSRVREQRYGPAGELYSGIPFNKAGDTIRFANEKLANSLGIPREGVTVERAPTRKTLGAIDYARSPSELVKKFPQLRPFKSAADRAQVEMDTLRDAFSRRLQYVDRQLGGGLKSVRDFGKQHRANKTLLNEILIAGDFLGKRFTEAELRSQFGANQGVINAYTGLRSAYDHALTLANRTRALRGKEPVARREGYTPHFFHDYFILGDGEILASARTLREAVAMGNDAAKAGAKVKIVPKQPRFEGEDVQAAVVGDATYFKLREALEEKFSMTPDQANMLLEDIAQMRGRSRQVGNFLERKGAPGWEKDLDYAHRHYFNMIARYVALDKFKSSTISNFEMRFGAFDKEHKGLANYIKRYIEDINGVPSRAEELLNNAIAGTPGVKQFAETYLGQRPSLQIASATTNAVAIAKLGLYNLSAAMVNGSQAIMSQAVLGPKWFAEGARRAALVSAELGKRRLGFSGATSQDIGLLRQMDVPVQQGLESGAGYSKFAQTGKLFRASTAFFRGVEFELRATTSLGAYYKALAEGRTKAQAIEHGRETNRRVNFDYSQVDAPAFIRRSGPLGQVLFQFKKFPIKALEFMFSLKGAEIPRFWIPFVLISGYYGFPGMEVIKNIVKGMFDVDIELEAKDYFLKWAGSDPEKKAIAKTVLYGAFANEQLGGVDISRRVGGGDFIPADVDDLFGPFFSSAIRATQLAARDAWVEALRAISSAPGNIALAIRNDGEITSPWDRERLRVKLDTRGRILKGIGFPTTEESIERDLARTMRYNKGVRDRKEKEAIDAFIRAYQMKHEAGMNKAIERFAKLGMGEGTGARIREEMLKKDLTPSERAFMNLPRKDKARELELMEFAQ